MTEKRASYYCVAYLEVVEQEELLDQMAQIPTDDSQQDRLQELSFGTLYAISSIRESINSYLEPAVKLHADISKWQDELQDEFRRIMSSDITIRTFGNSIILFIPVERKYPLPAGDIFSIFRCAATFALMLPRFGHSLRGGIALNWGATLDNGDIYGPAYYEAYHLAHEVADYPRILISRRLVGYLSKLETINLADFPIGIERGYANTEKEFASQCKILLYPDSGHYYLDYLGKKLLYEYISEKQFETILTFIRHGIVYIQQEIRKSQVMNNTDREKRYTRLKDYYRSRRNNFNTLGVVSFSLLDITSDSIIQQNLKREAKQAFQLSNCSSDSICYYCAIFLDFLGQKSILKEMASRSVEDISEYEFDKFKDVTFAAIELLRTTTRKFAHRHGIKFQCFSDTIILYIPLATNPQNPVKPINKIYQLLTLLTRLIPNMLANGYVLRGAIDINVAGIIGTDNQKELYGAAIRTACLLEGKAKDPRILVGQHLLNYLEQKFNGIGIKDNAEEIRGWARKCMAMLSADRTDNQPIVDYLGPYNQSILSPEEQAKLATTILPAAMKFVSESEATYRLQKNDYIANKYTYLLQYLSERSTVLGISV